MTKHAKNTITYSRSLSKTRPTPHARTLLRLSCSLTLSILTAALTPGHALAQDDASSWKSDVKATTPKKGDKAKKTPDAASKTIKKDPAKAGQLMADAAAAAFEQGKFLTALELAKKAAAQGSGPAHTLVGRMYAEGLGIGQDYKQAANWYMKGSKQGDIEATVALAVLTAEGRGTKKDKKKAATLFEQAAKKGNKLAQYNMGLVYSAGEVRPQDMKKAAFWLTKAAEQGHGRAQYDLAAFFAEGIGVEQDPQKAAGLTRLAADGGLSDAQVEFAIMLFKGRGVVENRELAVTYFRAAAAQGNAAAQNRLARLYAFGIAVKKDPIAAGKWHLISRQAGISDTTLDVFLASLTPEQRAKAETAAEAWKTNELLQ